MENSIFGYSELIQKLDAFIRKYYKNQVLRGVIYTASLALILFLVVALLEYVGQFNSLIRTILFWLYITLNLLLITRWIITPLFHLFKLRTGLTHLEAAKIIGTHFPDVSDKLLNTMQLHEQLQIQKDHSLLFASIEQRTSELKPVPFTAAVDLSSNRKYLKYLIPPLSILLILLLAAPSIITEPTDRLVRHREDILPVAPFSFELENDDLSVRENDDFLIELKMEGDVVPEKVYIDIRGNQFKLERIDSRHFRYSLQNVKQDVVFSFYADGFSSERYNLDVLPIAAINHFSTQLDYPSYTGITDETLRNTGDLLVPEGTAITWSFQTRQTEALQFRTADSLEILRGDDQGGFVAQRIASKTEWYDLLPANNTSGVQDSSRYRIQVIQDAYPSVQVSEQPDSLSFLHVYFSGTCKDDYSVTELNFHFEEPGGEWVVIPVPIANNSAASFFYHWDLSELGLPPGSELQYYFQVWDNDGYNGRKSSRTLPRVYKTPDLSELEEKRDQQADEIKEDLEESLDESKKLQKELEALRKDLLNKEDLDWQDRKKLEEMLARQKSLQEKVENLQKKNEQRDQQQEQFKEQNERIQDKQEQLQSIMDQVMSEEMKKLMEELEKLMEDMDKDEIQEQLEKMNFDAEDMEKELDRALEQFKQLEWEMKMEESIDKLRNLAEEQEKLADESLDKEADKEELKKKQDELNEQFEQVKEDVEELEKLNEDLENPNQMPDLNEQKEQVEQDMKESSEQLENDKKKKASESQKDASEGMQQMAEDMESSMAQNQEEKAGEDMEALRALLENIITLSFDQESLMENVKGAEKNDPKIVEFNQTQKKLKDDAKMVEDSLFALSKRVSQLQPIVNREIGLVNEHMAEALDHMEDRNLPNTSTHQQYVMTSFNNLALLLDEALRAMQEEMSKGKPGKGNCEKPGGMGSKPSASDLKKMQQALSKQLEEMKKQMGEKGKSGQKQKSGKSGMSKDIAEMAAKQAAIRREVEKMGDELNKDGSGNGNDLKKIAKEMEEQEKDLVNQQIDVETMRRQQDILTRLLKAENAEREREKEEQRKSNEAREQIPGDPLKYEEYQKRKEKEVELLKTVPPGLKPYYKEKVNEYFNKLGVE